MYMYQAKPGNWGTLAYIYTLGHTIRLCRGGEVEGKEDNVVGMQLCRCVW